MQKPRLNYIRYKDILIDHLVVKSSPDANPMNEEEALQQRRTLIFQLLDEFYHQNKTLIRKWLHEPKRQLTGSTPYSLMENTSGCRRVEKLVHQLFVQEAKDNRTET